MKTFKVTVDGQVYTIQVEEVQAAEMSAPAGSAVEPVKAPPSNAQVQSAETKAEKSVQPAAAPVAPQPSANGFKVEAPMPGSIIALRVETGDQVGEGDVLLILEAMKMENEITADRAGKVEQILVKKGDTVNSGDPLIILN